MKYPRKYLGIIVSVLNNKRNKRIRIILNLLNAIIAMKIKTDKVSASPLYIQLETTTKCNLKCIMCEHNKMAETSETLTFEKFQQILNQFPYLIGIDLTGIGEPLLNKEFLKMIEFAKERGLYVTFTDNFTLLNEEIARKLISYKVDEIVISLDGGTKEIYESIRIGANFDNVINNLKFLINLKKEIKTDTPQLIIRHIALEKNLQGIPSLIKLANSLGIKKVIISSLYSSDETKSFQTTEDLRKNIRKEAYELSNNLGIDLEFRSSKKKSIRNCYLPYVQTYITANGFILPCCYISQGGGYEEVILNNNFENIFDSDFNEIWNSEKYKKLRSSIKKGKAPNICKSCHRYSELII
ncbi:MAG: radical SAM protein [Thermodesulfobacteriota bacterium]